MAPMELPPRAGELMLLHGAVVAFGPDYLENSLLLFEELKEALAGKAVFGCEKIDDLGVPDGPMLNCLLVFFHRKPPAFETFRSWQAALLKGVDLRSRPPRGLGVADRSPEDPKAEFVPLGGGKLQLILTWSRPLESSHCARTARALERAYLENGGRYGKAGIFGRLRGLFS